MLSRLDQAEVRPVNYWPVGVFIATLAAWTIWAMVSWGEGLARVPALLLLATPVVVTVGAIGGYSLGVLALGAALGVGWALNGVDMIDHSIDRIGIVLGPLIAAVATLAGRRLFLDASGAWRTMSKLRAREAFLLSISQAVPSALVGVDSEGRILGLNTTARACLRNGQQLAGQAIGDVVAEGVQQAAQRAALSDLVRRPDPTVRLRIDLAGADGGRLPVEVSVGSSYNGTEAVVAVLFRDLTKRLDAARHISDLQEQVLQLSKVELAQEMVAGIGHELGQPLTAIANYAGAARRALDRPGKMDIVREALEGVDRAVDLSQQTITSFKDFLRGGDGRFQQLDIDALLTNVRVLARAGSRPRPFLLNIERRGEAPAVAGNAAQIELVLLNLMRNGLEAARDRRSPVIDLTVTGSDEGVTFDMRDNGTGIPADMYPTLFDPWRTTKREGLGVGLAISRRIAESHGGRLWADPPTDGQGATFHVFLPSADRQAAMAAELAAAS